MPSGDFIRDKAEVIGSTLDQLLPTYDATATNPIVDCRRIPAASEVIRALHLLDDVFFPGFRAQCEPDEPLSGLLTRCLDQVYDCLHPQVRKAVPLRWHSQLAKTAGQSGRRMTSEEIDAETGRIIRELFGRLPRIRELLKLDVLAAYQGDPAAHSYEEIILSYPGLRAITTHRVAHELYQLNVPLIPRQMNEWVHGKTGIDIHPGAQIGESFFIDHGTGVVIGETSEIGARVKLYQGVTLGARSFPVDEHGHAVKQIKRHPTIEDGVVIYSGATILGGDTVIGTGSIVGGNVWLTHSVPPNTTVTQYK